MPTSIPPIVTYDIVQMPTLTWQLALMVALSAITLVVIAGTLFGNVWRIMRPAIHISLAINVFFQWPSILIVDAINQSLAVPWWFLSVPHVVALALLAHAQLTRSLDLPVGTISRPKLGSAQRIAPVMMLVFFASLFFMRMPFACTALYALIFDPAMSLLAREVTIKFVGSTMATASFGAVANTVAPVCVVVAASSAIRNALSGRYLSALIWLPVIPVSLVLILVSATKGLLLPTIIVCSVAAIIWGRSWLGRIAAIILTIVGLGAGLTVFELVRERGGGSIQYDLAQCAVGLDACGQTLELLSSISQRGGLGLNVSDVEGLTSTVAAACTAQDIPETEITDFKPLKKPEFGRALTFLIAILHRAAVLPLQVASWHYLHVQEHGPPGVGAMPLALKLVGHSVDMSSAVYAEYGVIYSEGDRTSTSTSPISFIYAYPAYFGLLGLFCVVALIIAFDIAMSALLRSLPAGLLAIAAGLLAVMTFNFIASDFFVVMISHGGAVAVGLIALFALSRLFIDRQKDRFSQGKLAG